jgi:leucyl aminopeptidase
MLAHETRLQLSSAPRAGWEGELLLLPLPGDVEMQLGQPGKQAGDVLLVESAEGARKLLISLGPQEKMTPEAFRCAGGAAARWLTSRKAASAGVHALTLQGLGGEAGLAAFCEGLLLGAYRFDRHKSGAEAPTAVQVFLLAEDDRDSLEAPIQRAATVAAGVSLARDLAHEPPNVINPITLARRAQALAEETGLHFTLFDEARLKEIGAGAILAVGQGSQTPSQMFILEYPGQPGHEAEPPVAVVGKAITFDTGGYSLKDRAGMVGMKYDKSGGSNVLGIMKAVAELRPVFPVVGVVAAAENMVSAQAYRPNDIIRSLSGKTIEIISTDAEGRLVLADALAYASRQYQPRALIDLATLTGGIVVALGKVRAGLMSNNDALADRLFSAGERTHERVWRMPLDEDYADLIQGDDSDLRNSSAERGAHPIVGGIFLKQFVPDDIPWAHLDIAGPAMTEKDLPYCPKGATGFGVRLLLDYILSL